MVVIIAFILGIVVGKKEKQMREWVGNMLKECEGTE